MTAEEEELDDVRLGREACGLSDVNCVTDRLLFLLPRDRKSGLLSSSPSSLSIDRSVLLTLLCDPTDPTATGAKRIHGILLCVSKLPGLCREGKTGLSRSS